MGRKKSSAESSARDAIVGMAVSRFVMPFLKRHAKQRAATAVKQSARVVTRHPGSIALMIGAAAGAVSWVLRQHADDETQEK